MELKTFGTLYVRGRPVNSGRNYALYKSRPEITLGDTNPGKGITWVEWNGLFVAHQNLIYAISWYDLNIFGLISGKQVNIDGRPYNLRLMDKIADDYDEWDAILDSTEGCYRKAVFWDSKGKYSWTQAAWEGDSTCKILRGGTEVRDRTSLSIYDAPKMAGWRPVLEPVKLRLCDMQGKRVKVDGKFGDVQGILVSCTDYDIVLAIPGEMPETAICGRFCVKLKPGLYALDRSMVKSVDLEEST